MNNLWKKLKRHFSGKNGTKNLVISIVILVEVFALFVVGTYAWVETVSSIKITNAANTTGSIVNDTKYTDMLIGDKQGTINLLDYFEPSGDMHLAPASSADGKTFYFPKANITSGFIYRKGNVSDKNTAYISVSFRLKADESSDFFFTEDPAIAVSDDIRVSVTAYSEGENPDGYYDPDTGKLVSNTKIYDNQGGGDLKVIDNVNGTLPSGNNTNTHVEKFSDHVKGKSSSARLFAVGANETKYVTINVWLQKSTDDNDDLTYNMSVSQAINYLGITSDKTPRHVTLLPTPTWDTGAQTYYAWCWAAPGKNKARLYKLSLDPEEEHYTFDYNGTYTKTVFVRAVPNCTVQPGEYETNAWPFTFTTNSNESGTTGYWNQTEDTTIPDNPLDPTYIITSLNSGTDSKSTGEWHDPATIKVALCTECFTNDTPWGSVSATSYVGSTTSTHVIESTNSSSTVHKDTVHAWPGKKLSLNATVANASNYAFVGWYTDAAGTTPASGSYTNATYTPNAPATASEVTYYAKFKEVHTVTLQKVVDNSDNNTSGVGGSLVIDNVSYSTSPKSVTKDKNVAIPVSGSAAPGYTYLGVYTNRTGGTKVTQLIADADSSTYYVRFSTNSYSVTAYSSTGGKVSVNNQTPNATSSTASIKHNVAVSISATANSGYEFAGWYTAATGGTLVSSDSTFSHTVNASDYKVYARFKQCTIYLTGWINGSAVTSGQSALQFSPTSTANEYSLTYTFTGNQGGYQYVTIYNGTDVYHPGTHESGSGVAADLTKTDQSPNNDPKWKVNATSHDVVTFTWNNSTKTLSWSITKYYYIDVGNCSWFKNDGCVPGISYNYGAYLPAELVSGNIYRIAIPESVTSFGFSRHNSNGDYNTFTATKSGTNNKMTVNSGCTGVTWGTY